MDEIIKNKNSSFERYKNLLLARDAYKKEAFIIEREYTCKFGDLIIKVFEKKLECVRKKKTIEYFQRSINQGLVVDANALQAYVDDIMETLNQQLDDMIEDNNNAKNKGTISEAELMEVKKLYHKMVKSIHPDINPMVNESDELQTLWNNIVTAYNCNDLKYLKELDLLFDIVVQENGFDELEIDIPDIDNRIAALMAEIERIRTTDPYMYKFILLDPDSIRRKNQELIDEYQEYEEYSNQLEELLEGFIGKGVTFKWEMN